MRVINSYKSSKVYEPNTFIGGVGSTITTKAQFVNIMGIPANIVKSFQVVGNNIEVHIAEKYTSLVQAFAENTFITFFKDEAGMMENIDNAMFRNATNLTHFKSFSAENYGSADNTDSWGCFNGCINLSTLEGKPKSIGRAAFANVPASTVIDFSETQNLLSLWAASSKMKIVHLPALQQFSRLLEGSNIEEIYLNNTVSNTLTDARWHVVFYGTKINLIEAKKLKTLGTPSVQTNCFLNIKLGCTIRINVFHLTSNAGGADLDLLYAKNTRNCIVEFFDDAGNYVSTL